MYLNRKDVVYLVIITFVLVIFYHFRYGLGMLVPTNIGWLMHHDWAQHYLGWYFFRHEPWTFPLGDLQGYFYPVGTNVGFTDSIPLLAILIKPFSTWLPENFQYLGPWLFLCHILLAWFTLKLTSRFAIPGWQQLLITLLVILNPMLWHRAMHPALCSHWLIMGSFWLYFTKSTEVSPRRLLLYQSALLLLAGSINPYICAMVAPFVIVLTARLYFFDKAITLKLAIGYLTISFFALFVVWFAIGFFVFNSASDLGISGAYGLYAMNLNALYNSFGFSSIIPAFKTVSWHQYESFLYLGFGFLLLFATTFILFINDQERRMKTSYAGVNIVPLLVFLILVSLFAITNTITFNDKVLLKVPLPTVIEKAGDIFRASARFFWIPYYLILLAVATYFIRRTSPLFGTVFLGAVLAIQIYDYRSLISDQGLTYQPYQTPLAEKYWVEIFKQGDKILFYPPLGTTYQTDQDYRYFCYLAAKTRRPVDIGYVARQDNKAVTDYGDRINEELDNGTTDPHAIYVCTIPFSPRFELPLQLGKVSCINLDNYLIFYPKGLLSAAVEDSVKRNSLPIPQSLFDLRTFSRTQFAKNEEETKILSNIEQIRSLEKSMSITGWASLKDKTTPNQDQVYIILQSADNKLYRAKAHMNTRKDVSAYFNNSAMDSTGFYGTFFTDSLKAGNYGMALSVEDKRTGKSAYQFITRVNVGLPGIFEPKNFTEILSPTEIASGIDKFVDDPQVLKIGGWAALPDMNAEGTTISILLRSSDSTTYISPVNSTLRPDVTTYFENKHLLDKSGFDANISKRNLPPGKYQVGILIVDSLQNRRGTYFTDRLIEKIR